MAGEDPLRSGAGSGATCPSSSCTAGHLLLGIVRPDGTVAALHPPLPVSAAFAERAAAPGARPPEARFRFAGPCAESACRQWAEGRCSVGDEVAQRGRAERAESAAQGDAEAPAPPPCAIRSTCRWWAQGGADACRICPGVVHTTAAASA
ncbi:hypothetical protein ACGFRB_01295 [Streptomyces sp. NPDC048718]|uniref:hypothetical protein n=1 Tax=Streptomyces sp. NPDC048718 TaxID=3365587 RepID=UPI003716CAEB